MKEAIAFAKDGGWVDIDTVDETLPDCFAVLHGAHRLRREIDHLQRPSITSPQSLNDQIRACVKDEGIRLETVLPCLTSNTAATLKLPYNGT